MAPPRRVLFVCTGNICRSAMAEQLLRHVSRVRGLSYEARSCGMGADARLQVPAVVRKILAEHGMPDFEHTSRLVTREQLEWADLVLGMEKAHVTDLKGFFPEFKTKFALMRERAGLGREDIEDPMGRSDEVFEACFKRIDETMAALLKKEFA